MDDQPTNQVEEAETIKPRTRTPQQQMKAMTRRSLVYGAIVIVFADQAWKWLATRRQISGVPWPMAMALKTNEELARDLFNHNAVAKEYPSNRGEPVKDNGDIGRPDHSASKNSPITVSDDNWDEDKTVSLEQLRQLPKHEMTTELRCIEGWSKIIHWGGYRLADFIAAHPPTARSGKTVDLNDLSTLSEYVAISTADDGYFVGLDMKSALHAQTLLCTEMNGAPLTPDHGAPLRLVIPTKYGIKSIKWIGKISYTDTRPDDYWADQGYDWYAGL